MQLTQTLKLTGSGNEATVSCLRCDHEFGAQSENWKNAAHLNEEKMNTLGPPYTTGESVLLRSFTCPACAVLLDTEIATAGEAFLVDKIFD
jgi:acetone carboxylase gamma subunit